MHLFYNISAIVIGILALFMLKIRPLPSGDQQGRQFNNVKQYLSAVFLLTSLSMFVAQFETRIPENQFEKLNALMLLFFFLAAHGFIYSILILYASPYANGNYLKKTLVPILPLFALYTAAYFILGPDVHIYSAEDFFTLLPTKFLLILRSILLLTTIGSIVYGIILCHEAKSDYDRLIANYFSETDFARSIWLYKLMWSAEALSAWVVLTYFYTNETIEAIVGVLIMAFFAFYVKEFREYARRYTTLRAAIVFDQNDGRGETHNPRSNEETQELIGISNRMTTWALREDKPFTRSSLTIGDVSRETGVPKRKVSQYVNTHEDNFCAWINKLRVEEAARQLSECSHRTITEIGESVGFCDLPAFSRAFKKVTGSTPRAFRNGN